MTYLDSETEEREEVTEGASERKRLWNGLSLGANFVFAILYVIYAWQIGIAGFLYLALGLMVGESSAVFGDVICMLIPIFAIAAMIISELFRKKRRFIAAFAVHLAPLALFGIAWLLI